MFNKPIIRYEDSVTDYFNNLTESLFEDEYFGLIESALQYVTDLKEYVEQYISCLPKYPAPSYFSKYQSDMQYIMYNPNKRTTWHLFFLQDDNHYLICYITNNHFEGQYIR